MKKLQLIIFLSLCLSCNSNNQWQGKSMNTSPLDTSLNIVGQNVILLDDSTFFKTKYLKYNEDSNTLAILNKFASRIDLYDLSSGNLFHSYNYHVNGTNSIGRDVSAFQIISHDSIYVFDRWYGYLSLINAQGDILKRINFAPKGNNRGFAFPVASNGAPITLIDDFMYISGIIPGAWRTLELDTKVFLKGNLKSGEVEYIFDRPVVNDQFNWGDGLLDYIYYDYNPFKKEFYVSFANTKNVLVLDSNFRTNETYSTSSVLFDTIPPLASDFLYKPKPEELEAYYFNNPRFWDIHYDKYRDLIYRIVQYPVGLKKYKDGIREMKTSLIVLDSKFNHINEYEINNDQFDPNMIFITESGVNIPSKTEFKDDESKLIFKIIDFSK